MNAACVIAALLSLVAWCRASCHEAQSRRQEKSKHDLTGKASSGSLWTQG